MMFYIPLVDVYLESNKIDSNIYIYIYIYIYIPVASLAQEYFPVFLSGSRFEVGSQLKGPFLPAFWVWCGQSTFAFALAPAAGAYFFFAVDPSTAFFFVAGDFLPIFVSWYLECKET